MTAKSSRPAANLPVPSVTATRVGPPGCVLRASTVTPGSASPVASVTAAFRAWPASADQWRESVRASAARVS